MTPLDDLLARLAANPPDHKLDNLEPGVWRSIEAGQNAPDIGALPASVRLSTIALALAFGAVLGGAHAKSSGGELHEASVFTLRPDLAPSTLLGGGQ